MNEHGEETTIKEILEFHGVVGPLERKITKHLQDWISGEVGSLIFRANYGESHDLLRKCLKTLTAEVDERPWKNVRPSRCPDIQGGVG